MVDWQQILYYTVFIVLAVAVVYMMGKSGANTTGFFGQLTVLAKSIASGGT